MTSPLHVGRMVHRDGLAFDLDTSAPLPEWDRAALASIYPWLAPPLAMQRTSPSRAYRLGKRVVDVLVATVVLLVMAPVLLALVVAIKLDDPAAPVLFRQQRTGLGGRTFRMLKFRSMRPPTAADLLRDLRLPPGAKDGVDPRITPLGRLLRRTSLDELPQMFNVLRGDMSLVGPRPTALTAGAYELWQTERLEVKPGLTGLWQIVARGAVSFPNRCRLDIAYARRPSLRFDLVILIRSIPAVLSGRGAR